MNLEITGIFLAVAVIVAIVARRLKVPFTVGLVFAGAGVAFLHFGGDVGLTKEMVFTLFLPPLVFEAAYLLNWQEFKNNLTVSSLMATAGMAISTAVVSAGMVIFAHWPLPAAVAFAVLISATDPVSVIATMKEAGVKGRLRTLVESESLLNDGVAAVAFVLAVAFGMTGHFNAGEAILDFVKVALGGILAGGVVGGVCLFVAGRTEDYLIEIAVTTLAAFGSFLLAEHFHLSGVLATVTTGLMFGNLGASGPITEKGNEAVEGFWEFGAFLANSFVFLLIGVQEAKENFSAVIVALCVAIAVVLVGRALAVYGISAVFQRTKHKVSGIHQHVLFWGGLRGALALALALGLPASFPMASEIKTVTAGVVAFSIVVQGITITPLLKKAASGHGVVTAT